MNVAQLGFGRWGKNIYNSLNSIDQIDEIFVYDPFIISDTNLKILSLEEIINNKEIEAVFVVTPANTHFELTKTLLLAGKNVFCEKPLCFNKSQVDEIEKIIKDTGKTFISGHTFLFNDTLEFVKNYIDKNQPEFKTVSGKYCSFGTNIADIDVLWDFGPHVVSMSNYIFNSKPDKVNLIPISHTHDGRLESCILKLSYMKINVVFELSWISIKKKREIEFNGYKTLIKWSDVQLDRPIEIYEKNWSDDLDPGAYAHFHNIPNSIFTPPLSPKEPLSNELNYFIKKSTNGEYKNLKSGIEFTRDVIETLEKAKF